MRWTAEITDEYAASTASRMKVGVKNFFQHLHDGGNAETGEYPDVVKWLTTSRSDSGQRKDPDVLLTPEDVKTVTGGKGRSRPARSSSPLSPTSGSSRPVPPGSAVSRIS